MSSTQINHILEQRLLQEAQHRGTQLTCQSYSVSDGGEGFLAMINSKSRPGSLQRHVLRAPSPEGKSLEVPWIQQGKQAFLESYDVIGNDSLATNQPLDPLRYSSGGLGVALKQIAQTPGIEAITIGLGSSAIVDGGLGLLAALGAQFYNAAQERVAPRLKMLQHMAFLSPPTVVLPKIHLVADVENAILGPRGGLRVYGPQKGLKDNDLDILERNVHHYWLPLLANAARPLGNNSHNTKGPMPWAEQKHGGAAGGVGLALQTFYAVQWHDGANWCVEHLELETAFRGADAIITGEGCFDQSSLEGKITGRLIALGKDLCKPVLGVFGQRDPKCAMPFAFERVPYRGASHAEAAKKKETEEWLGHISIRLLDSLEQLFDRGNVSENVKQNKNK